MTTNQPIRVVTVKAPVNIAVIKYWGKTDEKLILPTNDSISGTLSIDDLYAMTSVAASPSFSFDKMWLNGEEQDIGANPRLVNCLQVIRDKSRSMNLLPSNCHVHIVSRNNFPTAAGLASSAAGYACLVYALGHLFGVTDETELCIMARMGSGSATRSIFGGFVRWIKGTDSNTSIAKQIVDHNYWPVIRVLILVVNDVKKDVSSTGGMKLSVETSEHFKDRIKRIVPERIIQIEEAIKNRDLTSFLTLTMKDSNSFHSICMDTYPPIKYMNETSHEIVKFVHIFNEYCVQVFGSIQIGYTFDAGPNACIYLASKVLPLLYACINEYFEPVDKNVRGQTPPEMVQIPSELRNLLQKKGIKKLENGSLKYLINTKLGPGPKICPNEESLINLITGLPN